MKLTVEIKSSGTYLSTAEDVAAAKCFQYQPVENKQKETINLSSFYRVLMQATSSTII